ncbi:ABC transporter permease [Luteolibacter sp. GHJ8]|uniref:Autoinducer 2 import system permease protein LsrC n=1 Tax=Luteolibacter rhizosphaerae TaxID=2989719 RepID=A0ABT3G1M5_9BACT|nr:ABC transporter permease [Luteolibacter rhizosphaerae]MCW1913411.1 ABC transporter permease [Luteolibacter rhizosphaerae]
MIGKYSRELTVAVALVLLFVALAVCAPNFFDGQPLLSRFTAQMPALVAAIGITLVIITRQIDISIGAQFSMCAVVAGVVAGAGMPLPVAMLAAVGTGVVMGAFNGLLVAGLGLPSIVVTLATMVTWNELLRLWQQGRLMPLPSGVQWFGMSQAGGQGIVICCSLVLLVFFAWAMRNLALGRYVYATGTDAEAARLAGINPRWMTFGVFTLSGALAGIAAVLNMVQSPQVQPSAGEGLELKVIAAAVVGGVAITGGRGNLIGVLLGLMLLVNVNPALTHFHQPPYWERAIQGLVILLAVVFDGLRRSKK